MNDIWKAQCIFSPSVICLDLCNLENQVRQLEDAGISVLHLDLVDGHFSPSMPLGLETIRQLRKKSNLAFDVHLMTTSHDYFIDELLNIGVQQIVFHAECEPHLDYQLNRIHAGGARAGIALKPATPLSVIQYVIEKSDTILLMLINPGYAGSKSEKQVAYADRKISDLRKMITNEKLSTQIELDGRVSLDNIDAYGAGVADIFVVGSTCLSPATLKEDVFQLNQHRIEVLKREM